MLELDYNTRMQCLIFSRLWTWSVACLVYMISSKSSLRSRQKEHLETGTHKTYLHHLETMCEEQCRTVRLTIVLKIFSFLKFLSWKNHANYYRTINKIAELIITATAIVWDYNNNNNNKKRAIGLVYKNCRWQHADG